MNFLIILITAILANAVPIIRDLPPEPNITPNGDSNLSEDVLHRTPNPSEIHQRFYRSTDPNLETHVSNLQMVARVTNGIYLIQGITSGNIDSDELISEILRFGPVKPSDISAIDISIVQSAISDLKSLPEQLAATDKIKKVEDVFGGLKAMLAEVDGIGNLNEWIDGREHFKREIGRLAKDGLSATDAKMINSASSDWETYYPILTGNAPSIKLVQKIVGILEQIRDASVNLNKSPIFWKFSNFSSAADGISPILKAGKGVAVYLKRSLAMTESDGDNYKNYAKSIPGKVDGLIASLETVPIVSKLLASRREVKRQLRHTFGLPKGVSDLSSITDAIVDPWIFEVVKTKVLKTALARLEGLAEVSKTVDKSLDHLNVENLAELLVSMSDVSKEMAAAESGIPQGYKCDRHPADDVELNNFANLSAAVKVIDQKLLLLNTNRDKLFEYLKSSQIIEMCNDLLAICNKAKDDGTNVQDVVEEMKRYKNIENMHTQVGQIGSFANVIDGLAKGTGIQKDAETASKSISSLDEYQTALTKYSDYFKCLQDQDQLPSVFQAIDGLNRIRGWKDDTTYSKTLDNGLEVVKKVAETKSGLDNIKTSIKELSALKTKEADALKDLPEAAKHSEVIGKSVQGLAGMAEALKEDVDLRKVVDNIDVVKNGTQKTTDPNDVGNLTELVKVSGDVNSMLNSLTTFSTSLSEFSKSDSLAVHADTFSSAKQVSGVTFRVSTGGFSSMIRAVEELKKISPSDSVPLTQVEDGLKKMETLDLDFAGFHKSFDDSKNSLTALDLFFAKTWKKFEPTTPIPAQRPTLGLETSTGDVAGSGAQSAAEKDEEKKKEDNDDLKYAGGTVGFLLITLAIVFFLLYKFQRPWLIKILPCLCWKKEEKKEKQEDVKPPEPPLPPEPFFFGPDLPPIGYFFQLFAVPIFKQFEVMKTDQYLDTIDDDYMLYEYFEVRHDDAREITIDEEAFAPEWFESFYDAIPRHNKNQVMLKDYGTRFKNIFLHANYLMLDDNREPEKKDESGNENKSGKKEKSAKKEKSDKRFEDAGEAEGAKYILMERPFHSHPGNPRTLKNSTIPKFWWLAKQNKTQSIVMLMSPVEQKLVGVYYPVKENEVNTYDDLKLKCESVKIEFGGLLEIRTFTGTFEKEPPFTTTHYNYTGWLKGTYPANLGPLMKIFRLIATDSTPPIIHCSDGQQRTGMFALAGLMKHRIKMSMKELDIKQCMIDVMSTRVNALQDLQDVAFSVHLCVELLANNEILPASLHIYYDKMTGAWERYILEKDKRAKPNFALGIEEVVDDDDDTGTEEEPSDKLDKKKKKVKPLTAEEKKRKAILFEIEWKRNEKREVVKKREDALKKERKKAWDKEQEEKKIKEAKEQEAKKQKETKK